MTQIDTNWLIIAPSTHTLTRTNSHTHRHNQSTSVKHHCPPSTNGNPSANPSLSPLQLWGCPNSCQWVLSVTRLPKLPAQHGLWLDDQDSWWLQVLPAAHLPACADWSKVIQWNVRPISNPTLCSSDICSDILAEHTNWICSKHLQLNLASLISTANWDS